jgi:hypothetical protein
LGRLTSTILSALLLAGCLVTGPAAPYRWTLRAPASVVHAPHSRLQFTVETATADGRPVDAVSYVWAVDWVGLRGVEHQGRSFREERILVKGEPGTAVLRILASDGGDRLVEVARAEVQITGSQP